MIRNPATLTLILALLAACAPPTSTPRTSTEEEDRATLDAKREAIMELIGDPVCADVNDCRVIGFGAKPCGGVWSYLIYSAPVTDSTILANEVQEYNALDDEFNRKYGIFSTCDITPVPAVDCIADRCVAVSGTLRLAVHSDLLHGRVRRAN